MQQYTPREYSGMAVTCGSPIDLGGATQAELDALVREYLAYMAATQRN
jgi:hypothetical protein